MGVLNGKVALVSGASKGIGAGIAKVLAEQGAAVVVNYASSKEGADRVVAEIASMIGGNRLQSLCADWDGSSSGADRTTVAELGCKRDTKMCPFYTPIGMRSFRSPDLLLLRCAPPFVLVERTPATRRRLGQRAWPA